MHRIEQYSFQRVPKQQQNSGTRYFHGWRLFGLWIWSGGYVHLGYRNFGCRSKFNNDRLLCGTVCHGSTYYRNISYFQVCGIETFQGFLQLRWSRWKRKVFTRCIAIVPTLLVAVFSDLRQLTFMNDLLNAFMMVQLPFALVPLLTFGSSQRIMHSFRASL